MTTATESDRASGRPGDGATQTGGFVHPDYGELRAKRFHNNRNEDYWFVAIGPEFFNRLESEGEQRFETREACEEYIRGMCDSPAAIERSTELVMIPLGLMHASPGNARSHFDEGELEGLAASIRERGIIEPLIVRMTTKGGGGRHGHLDFYEVIAGERRLRAAWMAGLAALPCIVREENDKEARVLGLIENVQRSDLSAIEEAEAYRQLLEDGMLVKEIATMVGKSESAISNKLGLLKLPEETQALVMDGRLSEAHGKALKGYADVPKVLEYMTEKATRPGMTSKAIETPDQQDFYALERLGAAVQIDERRFFGLVECKQGCNHRRGQICLDPDCYAEKCEAGLREKITQLRNANPGLKKEIVSVDTVKELAYLPEPLPKGCTRDCENHVPVLWYDGGLRWVCTKPKCLQGKGAAVTRVKNDEVRKGLAEVQEAAFTVIDGDLTNSRFKRILVMAVQPAFATHSAFIEDAAKRLGIALPDGISYGWSKGLETMLDLPAEQLVRLAAELTVRAEIDHCKPQPGYGQMGSPHRTNWLIPETSNGVQGDTIGLFQPESPVIAGSESYTTEQLDAWIEEIAVGHGWEIEEVLRVQWDAASLTPVGQTIQAGQAILARIQQRRQSES